MCKSVNNHLSPATAVMKLTARAGMAMSVHDVLMIVPEHRALDFLNRAGSDLAKLLDERRSAYRDPAVLEKISELIPAEQPEA